MDLSALTDDEVAGWRARFPILARTAYLANHTLGAMPDTVPASLAAFAEAWATEGVEAWRTAWLSETRAVADRLGRLIGAAPGTTVVHQNVASLVPMVLAALPRETGRDRIVLSADEWPSHRYLLEGRPHGLEPVVVPAEEGPEGLAAALDERTALVITSVVRFRDACILDVASIARAAHAIGALLLADGYHATGHLPVDVAALEADAYVGGSVKWLCGGPGVGYLWIRPGSGLVPREVGWLGHARPFAFEESWTPAEGAAGWLGGTPAIPSLYAAREGHKVVEEVGPARIRATSERLTGHLVDGALARGLAVRTPLDPARRAGTVTIDLGAGMEAAYVRLREQGIVVDARPGAGIRVGPHFFSTLEECERVLEELAP